MATMTRRLHMGCGETLHSHLPESFIKLAAMTEMKQRHTAKKQTQTDKKGRFWK